MQQLSLFERARQLPERQVKLSAVAGEAYMLHVLTTLFVGSLMLYVYFVGFSVLNVISHREAIAEGEHVKTMVSELEGQYFELSKDLTPEATARFGLTSVESTYVRRVSGMASNAHRSDL